MEKFRVFREWIIAEIDAQLTPEEKVKLTAEAALMEFRTDRALLAEFWPGPQLDVRGDWPDLSGAVRFYVQSALEDLRYPNGDESIAF